MKKRTVIAIAILVAVVAAGSLTYIFAGDTIRNAISPREFTQADVDAALLTPR